MKKMALGVVGIAAILVFSGCTKSSQNPNPANSGPAPTGQSTVQDSGTDYSINKGDLVFFWGQGCPHCENVDKFLSDNKGLAEKLNLKKIEVFNDLKGQKTFLNKAVGECKLKTAGVPVLYQDGKCTQGDQPIIEELKKNL